MNFWATNGPLVARGHTDRKGEMQWKTNKHTHPNLVKSRK